jgi:carbon-monoxide dehydrogenase small subunit
MIMMVKSFLDENPKPTESQIREALKGNLCRCTGYSKVVEAAKAIASRAKEVG